MYVVLKLFQPNLPVPEDALVRPSPFFDDADPTELTELGPFFACGTFVDAGRAKSGSSSLRSLLPGPENRKVKISSLILIIKLL